jgi:hypothetical protein
MPNKHFDSRVKQRAIPPAVVDWLVAFGEEAHDQQQLGKHFVQQNQKYLNAYMVITTDGRVITIGWRTKKVWLH